jgi:hypothetical protein
MAGGAIWNGANRRISGYWFMILGQPTAFNQQPIPDHREKCRRAKKKPGKLIAGAFIYRLPVTGQFDGLFCCIGQFEGLCLYGLGRSTAPYTLNTNLDGLGPAGRHLSMNFLQVRTELPAGDPGNFGTHATEIFCFTPLVD